MFSIIRNGQNVEAAQVATDGWMNKQNVIYLCDGILYSLKKGGYSDTCHNMDRFYVKWIIQHTHSPYKRHLRAVTFIVTESRIMIPRDQRGSGNGEFLFTWDRVSVWQDGKSLVDGWGEWLLNNENVINSTELYTYKQLRWYILWEGFGGGAEEWLRAWTLLTSPQTATAELCLSLHCSEPQSPHL